jgi:regulator of PEP synthase PpsR (kinase-PPPase family)
MLGKKPMVISTEQLLSMDALDGWEDETQSKVSAFVLTSGMGEAGKLIAKTAAGQFPNAKTFVHVVPHMVDDKKVESAIQMAVEHKPSVILHSFCVDHVKELVIQRAEKESIPCVDLFGPMFDVIHKTSGREPIKIPGVYKKDEQHYAMLRNAMHFAIAHDDGAKDEDWGEADALIMGVSRVGKSPLCMFMATMGYKVANYPVCKGVPLPSAINNIDRKRVFGLTVEPSVLVQHRGCRALGIESPKNARGVNQYASLTNVFNEIEEVEQMYKDMKVTKVDCTEQPIQATANRIIRVLGQRFNPMDDDDPVQDDKAAATAATATAQVSGRYNRYQPLGGSFCRDHTDPNDRLTICLATTGVGISGERVLAAVQGQFPETGIHIIVLPHLTDDNLESVVEDIKNMDHPIVAMTIVIESMRDHLYQLCAAANIPAVDLLWPLVGTLQNVLKMNPIQTPGVYMPKDARYFHTVKAVQFALEHDNAQDMLDWEHADCVLLGAPMVGKTAISVFLGTMGWSCANATVNPDEGLPKVLDNVDIRRVFGLISAPEAVTPDLKRKKQAQAECIECGHMDALQVLLKESGITVLDVTTMPIESAANQVIKCLDERFPDHMHVGIHCPNGSNHREGPSW